MPLFKYGLREYMHKFTFIVLLILMTSVGYAQHPPLQYQPIKNAVYEDTITFDWKRVPLAINYTLQVSTDSLFGSTLINQTQAGNAYTWTNGTQGRYYWRVKANNTNWSAVRRVSILKIEQLPGLQFWMRPDKNITLVAGLVSSWVDAGSNGVTMTQSNAAQRPTYVDGGLNGKPLIQYGKTGTAGSGTPLSFPTITLTGGAFSFFTTYIQSSNTIGVQHLMSSTSQRGIFCGGNFGSGYNATVYDGTNLYRSTPTTSYLNWNVIAYRKTGIRRNGAPLTMTGTQPSTFPLSSVAVDEAFASTNFFHGKMGEMILTNTVLSDSLTVLVERYMVTKYTRVVRLPSDTQACNTSMAISVAGPLSDYQNIIWSTGASNTLSQTLTTNGTYWVRGTSYFGEQFTDTITVTGLRPKPIMNITTNQNICKNRDTLTFFVTNAISGQIYSWSTGEIGNTIHVTNVNEVYLVQTDPMSSCSFYSDTVQINHRVKADFANPAECPGIAAQFLNLSTDAGGDTMTAWSWTYGDPTTSLDFSGNPNGEWTYSHSGTYPVYLKVTASNGCSDSITKNVTIKPTAVPNFNWQGLCYGKPTQFFDQSTPESGTQVTGYQWTFGPGVTSSFVNPAVVFDTANVYPITLKIYTASNCNATLTKLVTVNKGVNAAFHLSDSLCAKQPVDAVDQSQGVNDNIISWLWRFGNNTPIGGQNPQFAFQGTGNRVVRLTTVTSAGCSDSVQKTVYVRPTPTASFSFLVNGGNPPFTPEVLNQSTDADHVVWNFGSGFSDTTYTPILPAFSDTGSYTVTLAVRNDEGCTDTASKNFVVFTGDRTLELISATCTRDGDFMTYAARVLNKGALEVNEITLGANTDYNSVIKEDWTGTLLPGQILNYTFKASAKYFTDARFCCVRIDHFNDTLTVKATDNEICLPLTNNVWFSAAYPTPSTGIITVDYIFPFADTYSAKLCQIDGKEIRTLFSKQSVAAGFGSFTADISDVRAGMYIIRLSYRDKDYSVKVIKQ